MITQRVVPCILIALAATGRLTGQDLVTHRFLLEDITEGFRVLRERIGDPPQVWSSFLESGGQR